MVTGQYGRSPPVERRSGHKLEDQEMTMQSDSLILLSRAIEAAFEAVAVPAVLLLGAAIVAAVAVEIRDHVRRRRRLSGRKMGATRYSEVLGR
jgi:hypothetical protein